MPSLSIGRVFSRTFEILKERWPSWTMLFIAFSIAPSMVFELIRWQRGVVNEGVLEAMKGLPGESIITGALTLCLYIAATRGVFDLYAGRRTSGGDWLGAISVFWPCLGLSILVNLAVIIGLVFLVVPGLFLMACLSVALPARVAEGPTVDNAMRRSFELTKGSRWQILGIILIGALIFFVPSMVNELVVVSQWPFVGNVVFLPVVTAILYVLMAVIPPVMYEELVALKGGRPDLTSEIFA
jgi:hypothetical protein